MELVDYYDILDIPRDASSTDIIRAYRLAISTYDTNSQASYSMFDDEQLQEIRKDIEEAFRTLNHSEKRKVYDSLLKTAENRATDQRDKNVHYLNFGDESKKSSGQIITGEQLKSMRKSRGITLAAMAQRINIDIRTLQAIEEEDLNQLSDLNQLREMLQRYASEVGGDPLSISQEYSLLYNQQV